jgi:biotin-dependent carboxylase-like uncharacterized protein
MKAFEVISPGMSCTIQDSGRLGWKRYGVPPSGTMDEHAAQWANKLLNNSPEAPVLECLLQGLHLRALRTVWFCWTGAHCESSWQAWKTHRIEEGEEFSLGPGRSGVWAYVAVEGGFESDLVLGSASAYSRAGIGKTLKSGDLLANPNYSGIHIPPRIAGRSLALDERRDYRQPPRIQVWNGPQWESFSLEDRELFLSAKWRVSSNSDRVGYRLEGPVLASADIRMISEPVRTGSIQVPPNGLPIMTMKDGPTLGGYPKIGYVDPQSLSWAAQCLPGQSIQFEVKNIS